MGKKFLFLEVVARSGKAPIVYVWTHHGEGLSGEWRGSILEPRKHSVLCDQDPKSALAASPHQQILR